MFQCLLFPVYSIQSIRHWQLLVPIYEGCSESNASHFIMLAHNVRGGCWWPGSRGWSFPPIFHYILFPCDRWQQRGSLTKWCLTQTCFWSIGVSWNSSVWKKPPIDIHQCLLNIYGDQTVDVSTMRWWMVHFSSGDSDHPYWCRFLSMRHAHCWQKCLATGGDYVEKVVFWSWDFALLNGFVALFVSVGLSMEINRRHYFWSNLCVCVHLYMNTLCLEWEKKWGDI